MEYSVSIGADALALHLDCRSRWKESHCALLKCWLSEGDYGVALTSCWPLNEVTLISFPALSVSVHFEHLNSSLTCD